MVSVDPDLIRRIGSNIMAARERAGLTIGQAAADLGLSPELLEAVERGDVNAYDSLDLLSFLRIVRHIGVAARRILFDR